MATGSEWMRQWRRDNPELARQASLKASLARKAHRDAVRDAAKKVPCADCKQRFPICAMDFDHRDPSTKLAQYKQVGFRALTREQMEAEVKKCDVVCAVCHRIRTAKARGEASSVTEPWWNDDELE